MTQKEIYQKIEQALQEKTELLLTVKHGLGEIIPNIAFQPYVLGDDAFQYSFTWGYQSDNKDYYRFMLSSIVSAKKTKIKYDVRTDACYQYAIDEDHFGRLAGFDNIYNGPAKLG